MQRQFLQRQERRILAIINESSDEEIQKQARHDLAITLDLLANISAQLGAL